MLRASFFSAGLFVLLWGVTFLFVDKIVLTTDVGQEKPEGFRGMFMSIDSSRKKVIDPPDWAAFSLMSVGSVTILYAVALPKKKG